MGALPVLIELHSYFRESAAAAERHASAARRRDDAAGADVLDAEAGAFRHAADMVRTYMTTRAEGVEDGA